MREVVTWRSGPGRASGWAANNPPSQFLGLVKRDTLERHRETPQLLLFPRSTQNQTQQVKEAYPRKMALSSGTQPHFWRKVPYSVGMEMEEVYTVAWALPKVTTLRKAMT